MVVLAKVNSFELENLFKLHETALDIKLDWLKFLRKKSTFLKLEILLIYGLFAVSAT